MARTCVRLIAATPLVLATFALAAPPVRFGAETLLPDDPRSHFNRSVNFAPADGQLCDLNPPRFRWRYHPSQPGQGGDYLFTFQVASDAGFKQRLVDVETEFNFYNTIGPLAGDGPFYWRVGYKDRSVQGSPVEWSEVRRFTLAKGARVWDRSGLAKPDFSKKPHPRILLSAERLPKFRNLLQNDPEARAIFEQLQLRADEVVQSDWYAHMPETDTEPIDIGYVTMGHDLATVAFCWRVTGEPKYAGVKDRALKMALYPRGGRSSPQAAGGDSAEDSTQTTEALGLLYDWLWQDMTARQRKDFAASLDWRIEHFVNHFAWKYTPRPRERSRTASGPASRPAATQATTTRPAASQPIVYFGSLSTTAGSHQYEGFWDTFPAALAAYEDSPNARLCFSLGVNYMVGVGSGHGSDEGWNEGPGYGNSKFAWMVNSLSYLDSVFPEFQIGRNPWLIRQGEWFRSVTPVGLRHAPWGHGSNKAQYYENGHRKSYRKLAYLTGDGRFLANHAWYAALESDDEMMRPWIECTLPLWRDRPEPVVQEEPVRLFPIAGWVTALSGPPSDPDTYQRGAGMIFACRSMGAYSHAFACDNSFHVFAYGQDISHAAGTGEKEPHAYSTMSHNAILVDGMGQTQGHQNVPQFGRIVAFGQAPNAVYWCGDATMSYPHTKHRVQTYWGSIGEVYDQRDLSYVTRVNRHVLFVRNKYFVILDDLAAAQPATWTWLYHAEQSEEGSLDEQTGSFVYTIGQVPVHVTQLLGAGALEVEDRQGLDGLVNPLTGEDYRKDIENVHPSSRYVAKHNLWLTTKDKHAAWRFFSVIYPVAPGGDAPKVERVDDLTIRVTADKQVDVISFDGRTKQAADIVVDLAAIAPAGVHEAVAAER
jgi:hypothetical protein